ncbi:hypothetical protein GW864_04730, partial [bacterium]|nr:hypothetical protein [bacterium]
MVSNGAGKAVSLIFGVLVLRFAVGFYIYAAWNEPSANPPSGNVEAPINISGTAQTKTGDLTVGQITSSRFDAWNGGVLNLIDSQNNTNWHFTNRRPGGGGNNDFQLFFYNGSVWSGPHLTVEPNGNVGIGTAVPYDKLDVNGAIRWGYAPEPTNYFARSYLTPDGTGAGNTTLNFEIHGWPGSTITPLTLSALNRVGIGTTSPADKLEVSGGYIVPAGGYGLNWRDNIWGGGGDDAWIRYYSEGGENTKLQIGINNDVDDDLELYQAGGARIRISGSSIDLFGNNITSVGQICLDNGCQASWPGGSGFTGSGTANYITKFTGQYSLGNSTIFDNGNVGIGTTNPTYKLDVSGVMRASRYYDDNTNFYIDSNVESVMNRILTAGRASDWGQTGEIQANFLVANTGIYSYGGICSGTASGDCNSGGQITAAGRIYANEWIQFDNYSGLYSPLNGAHFYP